MRYKKEIKIMKDYLTGVYSTDEFWNILNSNENLMNLLVNNKKRSQSSKNNDYPRYIYKMYENNRSLSMKIQLMFTITNFLTTNKIEYKILNREYKKYSLFQSFLPSWLKIDDEQYLENLWNNSPNDLTKTDRIKWCKNWLKEHFVFKNKPPKWLQEPEWPIINNKPLIFVEQKTDTENPSKEIYTFVDENGKKYFVEQFD